jgi:hypothetical protein
VLDQVNQEIDEKIEAVEREVDPRAQPIVRWVDRNVVDNARELVDLVAGVIGNPEE